MMAASVGPPPQRPSSMNPLGPFNRLGSMPSATTPGNGGSGGSTASPYMPRAMSGSAGAGSGGAGSASGQGPAPSSGQSLSSPFAYTGSAAAAAAAAAQAQAQAQSAGEGATGGPGGGQAPSGMAGAGSNAFGRNFPFGGPSTQASYSNAPNSNANANLDINDFPALGNSSNGGANGQQGQGQQQTANNPLSYASQAGTLGLSGVEGTLGNRTFSNDDFPALSGELGSANQEQVSAAAALQHQHLAREQHRRELLGAMSGRSNGTQALSAARGGFGERDRDYAAKPGMVSQQPPSMNSQTWSFGGPNVNGSLGAGEGAGALAFGSLATSGLGNGGGGGSSEGNSGASEATRTGPKTPAHQVLSSPADRFGLLGLVSLIKMRDPDLSMLAMGSDLQTLGVDMTASGDRSGNFVTPWAFSSNTTEPEFHLPACYNVQAPPPAQTKMSEFSDETLFFIFYSTPRDILQQYAAQTLYNRNWRFYRGGLNLWLTKEPNVQPVHKDSRAEKGVYVFWDPASWAKVHREFVLAYEALEERGPNSAAEAAAAAAAATNNGDVSGDNGGSSAQQASGVGAANGSGNATTPGGSSSSNNNNNPSSTPLGASAQAQTA